MSSVLEIAKKLDVFGEAISRLETKVVQMDKQRGETTESAANRILQKTLADGRGGAAAVIGMDGADTLGLLRATCPSSATLGWGSYLTELSKTLDGREDQHTVNKTLRNRFGSVPVREKAALAEQAGSTGGYTVPIQFYADLMRLLAEESFTRQLSTILPMQSRSMFIPAVDQSITPATGTSAFFGGIQAQFQPEGSLISNSQPAFRQLELVARDLVFTCVASNQLLQDNAVALDTVLTTMFKEAMAWFFDWYMLRGTGVNQPLGCLNAPCALSVNRKTASQVVLVDLANMMQRLVLSSWKNAVWCCHPQVLGQLIQMTTATTNASPNQNLVWLNPFAGGAGSNNGPMSLASPFTILGRPVYFTEKLPALGTSGDLMLIDFSKVVVGDRMAIQIETSPHILFQNNQLMWRIIQRWDAQPWLNAPITLADGSYQVSPIVYLNSATG